MSAREIRAGRAFVEVSIRDKTTQQLARIGRKFAAFAAVVKSTSTVLAAGMRNVGKGMVFVGRSVAVAGTSILATMGLAVKTFLDVSAAAKKAGRSIAGVDPARAERLSGALGELRGAFTALLFRVGEALAEPLTKLFQLLAEITLQAARWVKENQGLVIVLAAVAVAAVALGTAMAAIGLTFITAASAVAGIAAVLTAIATPAGAVVAVLLALAAAAMLAAVAFVALNSFAQTSLGGIAASLAGGNLLQAMAQVASAVRFIWIACFESIRQAIVATLQAALTATQQALREAAKIVKILNPLTHKTLSKGLTGAAKGVGQISGGIGNFDSAAHAAAQTDLAATMARIKAMSDKAKQDLMRKIGIGANVGGLSLLGQGGGSRSGFGVAGTSSAGAAGFLRSSSVQQVHDKEAGEKLDDLKTAIEAIELTATAEVG